MSGTERRTGGFGLAEVALAMGIIAFVLVGLLGLVGAGLQAGKESQEDMMAALVMRRALVELRETPYADLPSLTTRTFDFFGSGGGKAYFVVEVDVGASELPDPMAAARAKRVVVRVSWPEAAPSIQRESRAIETHVADY